MLIIYKEDESESWNIPISSILIFNQLHIMFKVYFYRLSELPYVVINYIIHCIILMVN
jgi:hypothetical protein